MFDLVKRIRVKTAGLKRHVVLPEGGLDDRMIPAARILVDEGLATVTLLGAEADIRARAAKQNLSLEGITLVDPATGSNLNELAAILQERRAKKGMTTEEALALTKNPLYYGDLMVAKGLAHATVSGAYSTTGDVMRASFYCIGPAAGITTVSSSFIMIFPRPEGEKAFIFSDCAVMPDPTSEQLADIAVGAAGMMRSVVGEEPTVAMLSFSTKGSAEHPLVDKVRNAVDILKSRNVDFAFDGEFQLDAAIVASVGQKKAPGSPVAGKANVLVFPDLNAGNIGYKLAQRMAGAEAIGPISQGLAKPACDLSRGCSVEDIVNTACIALCQAG